MTKQNVVMSEMGIAVAAAAVPASSPLLTYPPPRSCGAAAGGGGGAGGGAGGGVAMRKKYQAPLELGSAKMNPWVESMRASSPTHAKAAAALAEAAAAAAAGAAKDEYAAWMVRHPSALAKFDHIVKASMGKQIVMFLDYDGTLSPIVDDPDSAFMSDQMRAAVSDVAKCFPTAIVSGRCTDKVISFVRLAELYYAGSHGMDITGPVKVSNKCTKAQANEVLYQPASEFLPMIDEVYEALLENTKSTPGAKVENNKFCVSVHFRCVDEKRWSALAEQVKLVLKEYPKLRISHGRKVIEVRPTIKWDKGKALEFLLNALGYADCSDVFPVYIGDDRTDEDAFKVLRDRGQGLGILVSSRPKETNASYSLREPAEVMDFLLRLVEWKRLVQGLAKRR